MWIKGKITDVYHASGIVRGEDSKKWRINVLSPPWDRDARRAEFPIGFSTIDVPAMKLEVNKKIIFATQDAYLISELLIKMKWLLINCHSNAQIADELQKLTDNWDNATLSVANDQMICATS
ncbi:MAG: hypothetical protein HY231_01535 [Acidobacteria bacterium]|nr:hypothetical protein [Acidobacteriota bacterium]